MKKRILLILLIFAAFGTTGLIIAGYSENKRYIKELGTELMSKNETPVYENGEDIRININTADADELVKIKGIGKSKAERIVKYRSENGDFKSIEDIMKVIGIGRNTFEEFKNDIKV